LTAHKGKASLSFRDFTIAVATELGKRLDFEKSKANAIDLKPEDYKVIE
jgi:hypothetical protein